MANTAIYTPSAAKHARMELKTNNIFKQQLEDAATLSGMTLTAFVLSAAADKVRETMQIYQVTHMHSESFNNLCALLANPPAPGSATPAMRALFDKESIHHGGNY